MKQNDMESIAVIEHQLKRGYLDLTATIYKSEIDFIKKMLEEYKENHKDEIN